MAGKHCSKFKKTHRCPSQKHNQRDELQEDTENNI